MAYATEAAVRAAMDPKVFIALTNDMKAGTVGATIFAAAAADADAVIDAHCQKKYDVPFSTTPPLIERIAVSLTVFYLYTRRENDPPETVMTLYNEARADLLAIRDNKIELDTDQDESAPRYFKSSRDIDDTTDDVDYNDTVWRQYF